MTSERISIARLLPSGAQVAQALSCRLILCLNGTAKTGYRSSLAYTLTETEPPVKRARTTSRSQKFTGGKAM